MSDALAPARLSTGVRRKPMRSLHLIFLTGIVAVVGSLTSCRKTEWTKQEVIEWYAKYGSMVGGGLGYQGSDQQRHHFIARVMDDWAFIQIKKEELKLDDERPLSRTSSAPLAYYAVDPSRNFQKIEVKTQGEQDGAARRGQPIRLVPSPASAAADPGR